MYTEWRDVYFNPEVALSPERFKMVENDDFSHYEVHCTPGDKEKCENGKLIELNYIKELDKHWLDTSLAFLDKMKRSKQPFFLYHATRGCHFDNYPSDEWAGKSMSRTVYGDCMNYTLGQLVDRLEAIG
jgi:arylsulfatase A-like enzyme